MKKKAFLIVGLLLSFNLIEAQAIKAKDPLKHFEFFIGQWIPPSDHPMISRNPKMKDLEVIDFKWGANRKVIWSTTGIRSNEIDTTFSEGMISYNPFSKKVVWLEYQLDNELLFEGEYIALENGAIQRIYTVYYEEGYKQIPNPEVPGWTRLYRETFIPTHKDSINWITESYLNGEWVKQGQNNGDFKAVRRVK